MPSRSSRRKNASNTSPEHIAKLLQDGAVFRQPSAELSAAAKLLGEEGLITADVREFVLCANPRDEDYPPKNRHCRGRIALRHELIESGGELRCPECERPVFPDAYRKQRHAELRTRVDGAGIMSLLQARVAASNITARPVAEGVLRLDVGPDGLTLCVVDYCREPHYLSRERAAQHPTCFVVVSPRDFPERFVNEDWVCRVALADIICGATDLGAVVRELAAKGRPQTVANVSIPVCQRGPSGVIVPAGPARTPERRFAVEVGAGIVRVEGVKVIAEQAGPRFMLFRTLWLWFLDDLRSAVAPDQFRPRPLAKLIAELELQTGKKYPDETSVRRVINNMQSDMETKARRELGLAIGREDIVETCRWSGQDKAHFGYRINPFRVTVRPFQPDLSQEF